MNIQILIIYSLIYLFVLFYTLRWLAQFKNNQKPTIVDLPNWIQKIESKRNARNKMNEIS